MLFDTGRRVVSGLGRPRLRPPLEVPGRAPPRPPGKQPAVATEAPVVIALVRVIAQVIKIVSVISVRSAGTGRRSRCRSTGRRIKNHRGCIVLLVGGIVIFALHDHHHGTMSAPTSAASQIRSCFGRRTGSRGREGKSMFPLSQLAGSRNRNCESYVWVCRLISDWCSLCALALIYLRGRLALPMCVQRFV